MSFTKKQVIETFDEELLKVGSVILVKPSLKAMHYGIVAQVDGDKLYYTFSLGGDPVLGTVDLKDAGCIQKVIASFDDEGNPITTA